MQIADTVGKAGIKNRGKELIFKQKKSPYFIEEEEGKDRTNPGGFVQRVLESEPKHLAGVPNPMSWTGTSLWPVRNQATQGKQGELHLCLQLFPIACITV